MEIQIILNKINALIERRHWSINELTERAGLSGGVIYEWYGKKKQPSLRALEAVCNACEITLGEFFSSTPEECENELQVKLLSVSKQLSVGNQRNLLVLAEAMLAQERAAAEESQQRG